MNKTLFKWPVRVYYEDTDAGGVVYHASYIAFYERARTELLRHYHFDQRHLLNQQIAFVVRRMTVEYHAAAKLDDLLSVRTEIKSISRVTLTFTQSIVNEAGVLLNEAEVMVACINPHLMKPIALPATIVAEFKQ